VTIAIIGTGNVGSALARGWSRAGQRVVLGVRDRSVPNLMTLARQTSAEVKPPAEAAEIADVVVLALPWQVAEGAVKALGSLRGKIVIDCEPARHAERQAGTGPRLRHVRCGNGGGMDSASARRQDAQPGRRRVMADNTGLPHRPVMFMAGNDGAAKATVSALLIELGFEPLDAGDLTKARLLEPYGMVWINQALVQGKGRDWALAAVSRTW
jgi:predicted dinucleotide-binding enzyme